jgi:hypothetical protein
VHAALYFECPSRQIKIQSWLVHAREKTKWSDFKIHKSDLHIFDQNYRKIEIKPCGHHFISEVRGNFFVLFHHARHFPQIHQNENFCRIYGLAVVASVARLKICQILMR